MDDYQELKNKIVEHLQTAEMASSINDYLLVYQNYLALSEDYKQLSQIDLDKNSSDDYLNKSESYLKEANKNLELLHLSPEQEKKLKPRKKITGFNEFVGMDNIKEYLENDVVIPFKNHQLYKREKSGLFIYGPKGLGKTTLVQSLIHELDATGFFIEPFPNFNIYSNENVKGHLDDLFEKAEKKDNVLFYFDEPDFFFPKEDNEVNKETTKFFLKIIGKEMKRIRKKKFNILFVIGTETPDRLSLQLFKKGLFDDLIRIHHPDKETRKRMIMQRLSDVSFEDERTFEHLTDITSRFVTKEISRLCRQVNKVASLYAKDNEKPVVKKDQIDRLIADFEPEDDLYFKEHVTDFENSLPSNIEIFNQKEN